MASRIFRKIMGLSQGAIVVAGKFFPNGASAVSNGSNVGEGFTVARTSAGLFTITFDDKYTHLISATAHLQLATGDDKFVQVGTYTAANKTLTVRVWDISGAAETDVAANANNAISFNCVFGNLSFT